MTLKFEAAGSMAVDHEYGIAIYVPRIEPGTNDRATEYQFKVVIGGKSDGIAIFGTTELYQSNETRERASSLLLSSDELQWLSDVKAKIATKDDAYEFLKAFARGFLLVFQSESSLYTNYRYTMQVKEATLNGLGMIAPASAIRNAANEIILASLLVPCRGDQGAGI